MQYKIHFFLLLYYTIYDTILNPETYFRLHNLKYNKLILDCASQMVV